MRNSLLKAGVLAAMLTLPLTAASAQYVYSGTTVGGPTWNRPLYASPPVSLSAVGTNVAYSAFGFTSTSAGTFDFLSTATSSSFDNYLFLYLVSFNPLSPLANALIGSDDFVSGVTTSAGFSYALLAGQSYVLVTSGFANSDAGTFDNSISCGVNNQRSCGIVPNVPQSTVPEPASVVLVMAGLAGVFVVSRRRKA